MNCPQNIAANLRKCEIFVDSRLDFIDFKQWTSELERTVTVSLDVTCSSKGVFFLPWPMKARGLIKLNVKGCVLEGFFSESLTPTNLKDELQELSLEDCVIASNLKRGVYLFNTPLTKEIDCGQQTLQRSVWRNISYMVTNKMEDITIDEFLKVFSSLNQFFNRLGQIKYRCKYSNLKYIDESISISRSKYSFLLMTAYSDFPKLHTFRWTDNGYISVPQELIDWRKYFPQLKLLDLSYNRITKFNFLESPSTEKVSKSEPLVVDLSQNSVTEIPVDMQDYLTGSVPIIVDLTGNPLRCDCNFLRYKNYVMNALKRFQKYENLSRITCHSAKMHRKVQLVNYFNNNC
ncbi:uncharacterized protein LOC127701019 [Mytilus californianus]|uniref:uncharacterized protein LOC127701019 n=1 Tax=Mytilus californianus TaxID=6549 RepID=UPI0022466953|nr:uncharacterized protein LOC127701019 [Mytilus californianus]